MLAFSLIGLYRAWHLLHASPYASRLDAGHVLGRVAAREVGVRVHQRAVPPGPSQARAISMLAGTSSAAARALMVATRASRPRSSRITVSRLSPAAAVGL